VFGSVASDPTVSRTITALASDTLAVLAAIDTARASARARLRHLWSSTSMPRWSPRTQLAAAPTFKRGFGFHPLCAFVDYGPAGTGEMVAVQLRPGNAGSVRHEVAHVQWTHREEVDR